VFQDHVQFFIPLHCTTSRVFKSKYELSVNCVEKHCYNVLSSFPSFIIKKFPLDLLKKNWELQVLLFIICAKRKCCAVFILLFYIFVF